MSVTGANGRFVTDGANVILGVLCVTPKINVQTPKINDVVSISLLKVRLS